MTGPARVRAGEAEHKRRRERGGSPPAATSPAPHTPAHPHLLQGLNPEPPHPPPLTLVLLQALAHHAHLADVVNQLLIRQVHALCVCWVCLLGGVRAGGGGRGVREASRHTPSTCAAPAPLRLCALPRPGRHARRHKTREPAPRLPLHNHSPCPTTTAHAPQPQSQPPSPACPACPASGWPPPPPPRSTPPESRP